MAKTQINDFYDVAVCGAGPTGLTAALRLRGLLGDRASVLLLDRRSPWREPVACAEAVHALTLRHLLGDVDPAWIRTVVDGVDFFSPDGTKVRFTRRGSGYILDRARFHRGLAERCAEAGADLCFEARVVSVSAPGADGRRRLELRLPEGPRTVEARYVVDATGPGRGPCSESGLATGSADLETAAFALATGVDHDPRYIQLHYGSRYAPGGYAWVFPRDGRVANVGVVVGREWTARRPSRDCLALFLKERCPEAELVSRGFLGGPIPCGQERLPLGENGLFRAGDAAGMVNPLSRGGILEAMKGGTYVAEALASLLSGRESDFDRAAKACFDAWWADKGRGHEQLMRAKPAFGSIPDRVFDKAAHALARLPEEKCTLFRIFRETLFASPSLVWRMRSLLR